MVAIAPFRALRYNLDLTGDLSRVIAPPYDVIAPEEQERLYAVSPHNIVRLILGKQFPEDTRRSNRYTRAQATFEEWRTAGILARDDAPAIYLYEHRFAWEGQPLCRLGCVALLRFEGSVPEQVLRHEATFEEPKADRTRLIEAVPANLSPIFFVYDDPAGQIHGLLAQASRERAPLASVHLAQDEAVRIWAIQESEAIQRLTQGFAPVKVLIADGHHRFAVAWSKRERFGAVMGYFSWMEDPAVRVRPIHRVIRGSSDEQAGWAGRLKELCRLKPVGSLEQLTGWLAGRDSEGQFGCYLDGRFYQASLQEGLLADWLLHPTVPLPLAGLDVTMLHEFLIPRLLESPGTGRSTAGHATSANPSCHYTPHPSEAIAMVEALQGACAFLLRPIPLPQVFALAAQGLTLPQKTTYFYPKLLSGLFINPFD